VSAHYVIANITRERFVDPFPLPLRARIADIAADSPDERFFEWLKAHWKGDIVQAVDENEPLWETVHEHYVLANAAIVPRYVEHCARYGVDPWKVGRS